MNNTMLSLNQWTNQKDDPDFNIIPENTTRPTQNTVEKQYW